MTNSDFKDNIRHTRPSPDQVLKIDSGLQNSLKIMTVFSVLTEVQMSRSFTLIYY